MRLLLDTHVALWWLTDSRRLTKATAELLAVASTTVSVVSIWEIELKHAASKLPVSARRVRDELRLAGATILPLTDEHLLAAPVTPDAHPDPFDRVLLGVATSEQLVFLTADAALLRLFDSDRSLPIRPA